MYKMWILTFFTVFLIRDADATIASDYRDGVQNLRNDLWTGLSYNAKIRPNISTEVNVGFYLRSIIDLDAKEQKLSASGWFTVIWKDERLAWTPATSTYKNVEVFEVTEGEVWRPELVIENSANNFGVIEDEFLKYRLNYDGYIVWQPAKFIEVHCKLDMTYYPFDRQRCGITVSSWSLNHAEMPLATITSTINLDLYESNTEWDLDENTTVELSQENQTMDVGSRTETRTYSKVTFFVTLTRRTDFYALVIIIPCLFLSMLTMLVFLLPSESGEKASYCAVILLSIIVCFTTMGTNLPVSHNVPVIGVYMAMMIIIATLELQCAILVLWVHHHDPKQTMSTFAHSVAQFLMTICCQNHDDIDDFDIEEVVNEAPAHIAKEAPAHIAKDLKPAVASPAPKTNQPNGVQPLPAVSQRHLPPMDPLIIHRGKNKVRPDSETSVRSNRSNKTASTKVQKLTPDLSWQQMANNMDRMFLVIFIILTMLVHFIFILVLMIGGTKS